VRNAYTVDAVVCSVHAELGVVTAELGVVTAELGVVTAELGVVTVELERGPGSYGRVSAQSTTSDKTARRGRDYRTPPQPLSVWFADSSRSAAINITLADDSSMQSAEPSFVQFAVHLVGTTGLHSLVNIESMRCYPHCSFSCLILKWDCGN